MIINDFFSCGKLMLERLKESCGFSHYEFVQTGIQANEFTSFSPAALVVYKGFEPNDQRGSAILLQQRWSVIVVVRSLYAHQTGEGVRDEAGILISNVIKNIVGWQPAKEFRPMRLERGEPPWFMPGVGFYPVTFSVQLN